LGHNQVFESNILNIGSVVKLESEMPLFRDIFWEQGFIIDKPDTRFKRYEVVQHEYANQSSPLQKDIVSEEHNLILRGWWAKLVDRLAIERDETKQTRCTLIVSTTGFSEFIECVDAACVDDAEISQRFLFSIIDQAHPLQHVELLAGTLSRNFPISEIYIDFGDRYLAGDVAALSAQLSHIADNLLIDIKALVSAMDDTSVKSAIVIEHSSL